MKPFMDADFLLQTDTAKTLYHEAAEKMPIFDYHNHLNPQEILEDRQMENLTRVWLGGDHYKWRAMRAMGFSEDLITGNADDYDKYLAFAETIENAIQSFIPLDTSGAAAVLRHHDTALPRNSEGDLG